ncbi:hypothetical protein SDC9_152716 [bioreactor metagenome]|uniref:Uncharacterized protein n=1 Tax=bioreactor metagenome TaxID=1076179 RepID=A0A645EVL2_9ZZZZ
MRLCSGEVEVHRHHAAGLDERLRDDALAGASLMRGQKILCAEQLGDLCLQTVEGCASRIAVVRGHHCGGLLVAHGVDAAVGEHIQKDILVAQQKRIVARGCHRFVPFLNRQKVEFLHDANLVHFEGELFS